VVPQETKKKQSHSLWVFSWHNSRSEKQSGSGDDQQTESLSSCEFSDEQQNV
jgi:hypothetical protein